MVTERKVSHIRIVFAAILDFFMIFFTGGYIVGKVTGNLTDQGFQLTGWPAAVLFGLIIGYFVAGKYLGGTIWQRILKTR